MLPLHQGLFLHCQKLPLLWVPLVGLLPVIVTEIWPNVFPHSKAAHAVQSGTQIGSATIWASLEAESDCAPDSCLGACPGGQGKEFHAGIP